MEQKKITAILHNRALIQIFLLEIVVINHNISSQYFYIKTENLL